MPTSAQHMKCALHLHKPVVERSASQPLTLSHGSRRLQRVPPAIFVCLVMAVVLITAAVLAPWLTPFDPTAQQLLARLRPPVPLERSLSMYVFGTDELGRDLLSRCLYGMRVTMGIAAFGMVIGLCPAAEHSGICPEDDCRRCQPVKISRSWPRPLERGIADLPQQL